jgi:hypothetical protein
LAASADKLAAARLLHPPSGGSGVVHTAPFFLPIKISYKAQDTRNKQNQLCWFLGRLHKSAVPCIFDLVSCICLL